MPKQETNNGSWYFYVFELSNTRPALEIHVRQLSTEQLKDKLIEYILELKEKDDEYDVELLMKLLTEMQNHKLLNNEFEYGRNTDLKILLQDHLKVGDQDYYMEANKSVYFITRDPNFIIDGLTAFLY